MTAAPGPGAPVAPGVAPLHLGPIAVDPPVVLAPMAGVTNPAFRAVCRSFGGGLLVSEMVNARGLVEGSDRSEALVAREAGAPHHSVQLYGTDPVAMGAAVHRLVDEMGADHVDLNFGCPVPKVTRKGGGAALPVHRVLFGRVVAAAVAAAGDVPVTVKMRIGTDHAHRTHLEAGRIDADAGAAAVALHARTAEQRYSGAADWSAVAELRAAVPAAVPVLGNGDVWTGADALRLLAETGCDGVVVGRGCLGRPWLFAELAAAFAGAPVPAPPTLAEVVATMGTHVHLLVDELGEVTGVRSFRKHVAWYLLNRPVGRAARADLVAAEHLAGLDAALARLLEVADPSHRPTPAEAAAPRGHTNGPSRVVVPDGWYDDVDDPTPPRGADLLVSGG